MYKFIFGLLLGSLLLSGKPVEPKVMRGSDSRHHQYYANSSHAHSNEERILSSTAEASAQISIVISLEGLSQITSEGHHGRARISYLDDNRIDIMEEIAKGQGEHLTTLLTMMNISNDKKKLEVIQKNFEELAYLSHGDFLDRLEEI